MRRRTLSMAMTSSSGVDPDGSRTAAHVHLAMLTPLALEYSAACEYLKNAQRLPKEPYPTTLGMLEGYTVAVCMPPQTGGYAAADAARRAVSRWRPQWFAVLVGHAASNW